LKFRGHEGSGEEKRRRLSGALKGEALTLVPVGRRMGADGLVKREKGKKLQSHRESVE